MTSKFDLRLQNVPAEWNLPLAEVADTADAIRLLLEDWQMENPELLLGLTKLVLQRHDLGLEKE